MKKNKGDIIKKIKVVIMGSENAGKTTFMEKLIGNIGKVEYNGTTTAIDYGNIELNNKKIHIFGTPGQERFEFMRELTLKGVDFVILIIDISTGLKKVDKQILNKLKKDNISYSIFINKIDKTNNDIIDFLKEELLEKYNCKNIISGSAKENIGISDVIELLKTL